MYIKWFIHYKLLCWYRFDINLSLKHILSIILNRICAEHTKHNTDYFKDFSQMTIQGNNVCNNISVTDLTPINSTGHCNNKKITCRQFHGPVYLESQGRNIWCLFHWLCFYYHCCYHFKIMQFIIGKNKEVY